jgi:hypothetical protein
MLWAAEIVMCHGLDSSGIRSHWERDKSLCSLLYIVYWVFNESTGASAWCWTATPLQHGGCECVECPSIPSLHTLCCWSLWQIWLTVCNTCVQGVPYTGILILRTALFQDTPLRVVVIYYRPSGQTVSTGFSIRTLKLGQIGCPQKSVRYHHYWLCSNPE